MVSAKATERAGEGCGVGEASRKAVATRTRPEACYLVLGNGGGPLSCRSIPIKE